MRRPLAAFAVLVACGFLLAVVMSVIPCLPRPAFVSAAESPPASKPPATSKRTIGHVLARDADPHVKLPSWWKAGDPVPKVKSNCVRCHLTAGRELTAPVQDFARSVHDLQGMTCSDCHGGNREKDAEAHEEEFGFIGTKLSAHMANCADCHGDQAEQVKAGPHYWDFSKKINLSYPVCIDCHGHHDVGKPPQEFALMTVCSECHVRFEKQMPAVASVVAENDRLWSVLRKVEEKNILADQPIPARFHHDLAKARGITAGLIHPAGKITAAQAAKLNADVTRIRKELETYLAQEASAPRPPKGRTNNAR